MATATERLPSGFTTQVPTAAQVRADVARAVAGLEAWHGEIARRRRELEEEDRQLEDLERELTARVSGPAGAGGPVDAVNGVYGPVDEEDADALEIEVGKLAWDATGLAQDLAEVGRDIRDAAGREARDQGHDATNPPEGPAAELGQDGPALTPPGQEGREPGEARHEAAASLWESEPGPVDQDAALLLAVRKAVNDPAMLRILSNDAILEALAGWPTGRTIYGTVGGVAWATYGRFEDGSCGPAFFAGDDTGLWPTGKPTLEGEELAKAVRKIAKALARHEAAASTTKNEPKAESSAPLAWFHAALLACLEHDGGPDWSHLQKAGATDCQILLMLDQVPPHKFGSRQTAWRHSYRVDPVLFHFVGVDDSLDCAGLELVTSVRRVLGIGEPKTEETIEELPAGGAVSDWRSTNIVSILASVPEDPRESLDSTLDDLSIDTVGDLCTFLTDEGKEFNDITTIPAEQAELCRALEVFRKSQGWDDTTQYPAGIPAGWFEAEEADKAAKKSRPPAPAVPPKKKKNRDVPYSLVLERLKAALDPKWSRWELLRQNASGTGTSDAELMEEIGRRFDKHPRGKDWSVKGGDNPKMWATASGSDPKTKKSADIQGPELRDESRRILKIPFAKAGARPGKPAPAEKSGIKPMKGKGKPRVLPEGGAWTAATLSEARERLDWRSHTESLFVCDKPGCGALFFSHPGKAEPCPECGGRKRHTYAEEEAEIKKAEQLADTSHGFAAPGKSGGKAKPDASPDAWDRKQVGNITLNERSPAGSLNGMIVAALELEHPHWSARWAEVQKTGATDSEILDALKRQWPFAPRFTAPPKDQGMGGFTVRGGKSPGFWQGAKKKTNEPPSLEGKTLAWRVRAILGIGEKPRAPEPADKAKAATNPKPRPKSATAKALEAADVAAISDPDPAPVVVPEPVGKWSIPKMGEAADEILGPAHKEGMRDAGLVVCLGCNAMRRRGPGVCPECDAPKFRSYAAVRAEVIHAGSAEFKKQMERDRAASR